MAGAPTAESARAGLRAFAVTLLSIGRWRIALAIIQTMLVGLTAGAGLVLLLPLLALTGLDAGLGELGISRALNSAVASLGVVPTLPLVLGVFLGVTAVQALLGRWQARVAFGLERDVGAALRERLYDAIVGSRWTFFAAQRSTDLSHALTTQAHTAAAGVHHLVAFGSGAAVASAHLALAIYISPPSAVTALLGGLLLGGLLQRETDRARAIAEAHLSAARKLHGSAVEHVQSFKTMKSCGAEGRSAALFRRLGGELAEAQRLAVDNDSRQRVTFEIGSAVILAVIVVVALRAALPAGALLILLFAFARLMPRVFGLQQHLLQVVHALPAFSGVCTLINRFRSEREPSPEERPAVLVKVEQGISLRRVSFSYPRGAQVLRDLSFDIPAGRITALVGASGAGKTTVLDLLMRLLTPSGGDILVDGRPLETVGGWRHRVGYVSQDSFFFNDTVRANLRWASPGASEEALRVALERASAWEFVSDLDSGLDTPLGDRGCRLSGGQRQRLALARALLGNPTLLILDEATSNVDPRNEERLLAAIEDLGPDVTVVIVAHRLSCVMHADIVHLLEDGRIAESGPPGLLLAQSRRFQDLQSVNSITASVRG